jgi:hypothetical protein
MVNFLVLDYNRPTESALCLTSIRNHVKFDYKIIYLSNGGQQDYPIKYYARGLVDKLILRKDNSGCGLGTRELFNDFDLNCDLVCYVQCDQFMIRDFVIKELNYYKDILNSKENCVSHIDLAGNQGHGIYSERAHLMLKSFYNKIPNGIAGPGPFSGDGKWTEQYVQEYLKEKNYQFVLAPLMFADNGKVSIREYKCGGKLCLYTDTKELFILSPLKERDDQPNLLLTDEEWLKILNGEWVNGTIPEKYKDCSFKVWEKPIGLGDFIIKSE